ncbi:dinitrogenase iron-molybdenum cofactor biosynthesis protein [Desulfosporosinus orientis DSM 765]|uniref:Dinitrogenase iron-molybdenum cofactor biosynthesis protein n=1 Tax=Desulfosporosinus orientis (strain ATCC 19365 / DSM 765 / NCIMB 8382 / VKM B-1628 / Singapore I) TaxID=768706 RepID=G7WJH6_DESOD|nr:NifB/NifX family molybdenum-iron cluster-binding protein [Desulfosporosinus orientis]AET70413.1 dinitrogenase iron-molybdenum cofactor biosynthesis protein [Desulfosporosinus orientis DSM 765]
MLVAFASSDGKTIDSHFASAPLFEMYKFAGEPQGIIHTSLSAEDLQESEDKVDVRIKMLRKCDVVYCTQIGGPAAARLVQSGIHPLKVPVGTEIEYELNRLKQLFQSKKLPPWLKKKLENKKEEGMI